MFRHDPIVCSHHYYDNPGFVPNGTSLPLKLVIPPTGPWQRYDSYDQQGRPLVVVSQFLNAPTNADASVCYRTDHDYTPISGTGDDGSQPHIPRTTVQYLLGHEIGRSYTIIKPGEIRHIQCQTPGAAWDASDNLVTVRTFYTTGTFANYPRTIDDPGGTRQVYFYNRSGSGTNTTQTTVVLAGQPDPANATNILSGTVTTTVVGHLGQTLSRTVQDKSSAIVLAQETYQYLDEFYRSYTVTHLNGTSETYQYGCCGLDIWTDTDGRQTQYLYDTAGRQVGSAMLPFNPPLITTNQFDPAGQVLLTVRTGGGLTILTAQFAYNNAGEMITETNALGGVTTYTESTDAQGQRIRTTTYPDAGTRIELYYADGQLAKLTGTAVNPVRYEYGVEQDNTTWRIFRKEIKLDANYADTSEWTKTYTDMVGRDYKTVFAAATGPYPYRQSFYNNLGQLWKERDPDAASGQPPAQEGTGGPVYTYTAGGRLATRVWKRGVTTTYSYNTAGDLQTIDYSDNTPDISYTYDRRGRRTTAVCNGITTTWTYNDANQPLTESYSGGTLASLSMNWTYDTSFRLQTVTAKNGANTLQSASYGYDTAGRLQTVTDSPYTATYTYHPNSTIINTVTFANNGVTRLVTTRVYDKLNRLTSISSVASGPSAPSLPVSFGYQYNAANQRTRMNLADGSYWVYQYDALGQVVSGKRYWSDGTPVAGQQFEYGFDDIGNRKTTAVGGDASGGSLRWSQYTANRLNQYSSRTVPAYVDILGIANPTAGVTVNGNTAQYRRGEYFHHALNVPNSTAQYPTVTVASQYGGGQTESGKVFVPPATESFTHDADGNLTQDGRWDLVWDGENRLVKLRSRLGSPAPERRIEFEYDHQGRRIRQTVFNDRDDGQGSELSDTIFLYDGWNLVAELNANASNARVRTYVWGTGLSGSMQGAGGVGGLLKVTYYGGTTTNALVAYDGNGNVTALIDAANGNACARYEYGPFAEPIRVSGPMGKLNPVRFSSKYTDDESGFLYYGYRFYNPSTGRWLSRDPIGELGGDNLYGFVDNDPLSFVDFLGLADLEFWSEGRAYYDARPWAISRKHSESGVQSSTSAYFYQVVIETGSCPGGTCNTDSPEGSSFIRAKVKNVSRCPLTVDCECNIHWFVSNYTPGRLGRKGALVKGHVLDHSFYKLYLAKKPQPDGSYFVVGIGDFSQKKTFSLAVGASKELYDGHDEITSPPDTPGAGWTEAMSGDCSCTAR
ncbi:MAG: RHS repeat-associated core domain-containing protein [Verrucomicrobia bacterium]|nr:RHS repeat-associated core domain-containing protein [Verrucomicrobiota bacterium]